MARRAFARDLGERHRAGGAHGPRFLAAGRRRLLDLELLERVPRLAVRALARPAQGLPPALGADEGHGRARHDPSLSPAPGFYKCARSLLPAGPFLLLLGSP